MSVPKRRFLVPACAALLCYAATELAFFGLHYLRTGEVFSFSALHERQQKRTGEAAASPQDAISSLRPDVMLHPYLGYIRTPQGAAGADAHGLIAEEDAFAASRAGDTAIVGLTGASVIYQLYFHAPAREILRRRLARLPQFKDRRVVIILLASHAYKQPQQLISAVHYLMQGGRLDLLVNLDGKNEVTLPGEIARTGVHPSYPYLWASLFPASYGPQSTEALGRAAIWRSLRGYSLALARKLDFSVTASTLWLALDQYMKQEEHLALAALSTAKEKRPLYLTGPAARRSEREDMPQYIWAQGSLGLHGLAQAYGFEYVHFLQPSQYTVEGKPLSAEEIRSAYAPSSVDEDSVQRYYPLLQQEIPELRKKGVKVSSLVRAFADHDETLYIDTCCHLNDKGHILLAEAMARGIAAELGGQKK